MPENPTSDFPAVQNTVDLLKAVLAISRQEEIEAIAHEACKQIAVMLRVFTVSFIIVNQEEKTGQLISEYISEKRQTDNRWYQPISYTSLPIMAGVIERRKTFQFHKDDPAIKDSSEMTIFKEFLANQIVMVPVLTRDDIFGMLLLWERSPTRIFHKNDIAFLELLANNVGIIIERSQLISSSERRTNELESLHDVSLTLSSNLDMKKILQATVKAIFQIDDNVLCASVILNENDTLKSAYSRCADIEQTMICPENNGIAMQVMQTGNQIIVENSQQTKITNECFFNLRVKALIGLPLKTGAKILGVLQIAYQNPKEFSTQSINILEMLADRAAMAIHNVQLLEKITTQAMTDSLTGIANRRAFEQALQKEIARTKRNQSEFCLLFIDLDDFKQVNDRFGHPAGDRTLQKVTQCFLNALRKSDLLARIGGDEFVILLPDTGIADGEKVANTIRESFKACEFDWKTQAKHTGFGVSVGVVQYPDQADSIDALHKRGDEMLYQNKIRQKTG